MATRAIVTRALEQAGSLSRGLEEIGIEVILSPAIRFEEPRDWSAFDRAVERAAAWDWVILTSANGVKFATRRLAALGGRWSGFSGARFAAIGPATARALAGEGVESDLVPAEFRAEGILEALGTDAIAQRRVLLARAEKAREILPEELRRRGAIVEVAVVYRTVACPPSPGAVEALSSSPGPGLLVIFTSPSTVESFLDGLPGPALTGLKRSTIAAIGPVTAGALESRGLKPSIQPSTYTIPALVEALGGAGREA